MGDGPLTVMGGVEGLAFINTKYANHSVDTPDIELHFVSGSTNSDGGVQLWKAHGLKEEFYKSVYEPINNKDVWSAIPVSKMLKHIRFKNFTVMQVDDGSTRYLIG